VRDLASLYRAWQQLQDYESRGLPAKYVGAVFSELHVDSFRERRTEPGARMAAALLLETAFKPRQPQLWRL